MKKLMVLLLLILAMVGIAGVAQADIFSDATDYIKERSVKGGIFYELQDNEALACAGTALVENAFGVDKLDIDLLVAGEGKDIFDNDNKLVVLGASYNLKIGDNSKLSLGAGAGLKRIEKLNSDDLGEGKIGIYAMGSVKF